MKKVIIASFQRSGTHFLINNLATNFQDIEDGWVDVFNNEMKQKAIATGQPVNLPQQIWEQLKAYAMVPQRRCVKTHFQSYFFEPDLTAILEKYDVFYMIRDPRDTMAACFNYYNLTRYEAFIREPIFSKFLRTDLSNVRTETDPCSYSYIKPRNIVDKWNQHVLSWLPYENNGVHFVKFSDLKYRWRETLQAMAGHTTQRLKPDLREVSVTDQRVRPDFKVKDLPRGEVGVWQRYFTADDLRFLDENISPETRQFLDEPKS